MLSEVLRYLPIIFSLIIIGLVVMMGFQSSRIKTLEQELKMTVLERDGFKALSANQLKNLTDLKDGLRAAEETCSARLRARDFLNKLFPTDDKVPPKKKPVAKPSSSGQGAAAAAPKSGKPVSEGKKEESETVTDETSVDCIRFINDIIGVFSVESGI